MENIMIIGEEYGKLSGNVTQIIAFSIISMILLNFIVFSFKKRNFLYCFFSLLACFPVCYGLIINGMYVSYVMESRVKDIGGIHLLAGFSGWFLYVAGAVIGMLTLSPIRKIIKN